MDALRGAGVLLHIFISLCLSMVLISTTSDGSALAADPPAKRLFGAKRLPALLKAEPHGFYSKGCLAGGVAMPINGPTWQVMRLSRNRNWGHPSMIRLLQDLSVKAKRDGWNGLLVGDIAQPRGGPMLSGHASHQVGLDADVWLRPMPNRRLTRRERENISAISMLRKGSVYVNDRRWTRAHEALLRHAAQYRQVQRIFVHPGIKKKLCDTVRGDRRWLSKIRPYWGHHYHFHIRMRCPAGSPDCKAQARVPAGTGCDKTLRWWFDVAFAPPKKIKRKAKKKKKKVKRKRKRLARLADLPRDCRVVLNARAPRSVAQVTLNPGGSVAAATALGATVTAVPAARAAAALAAAPGADVAIPTPRPKH